MIPLPKDRPAPNGRTKKGYVKALWKKKEAPVR